MGEEETKGWMKGGGRLYQAQMLERKGDTVMVTFADENKGHQTVYASIKEDDRAIVGTMQGNMTRNDNWLIYVEEGGNADLVGYVEWVGGKDSFGFREELKINLWELEGEGRGRAETERYMGRETTMIRKCGTCEAVNKGMENRIKWIKGENARDKEKIKQMERQETENVTGREEIRRRMNKIAQEIKILKEIDEGMREQR